MGTALVNNVAMSWANLLFDGDIVYPMAEYGQRMAYAQGVAGFGIDERSGSLSVHLGIAPSEFINMDKSLLSAIYEVLKKQANYLKPYLNQIRKKL